MFGDLALTSLAAGAPKGRIYVPVLAGPAVDIEPQRKQCVHLKFGNASGCIAVHCLKPHL